MCKSDEPGDKESSNAPAVWKLLTNRMSLSHLRRSMGAIVARWVSTARGETDELESNPFRRHLEVRLEAVRLLGERPWFLLSSYGKLMDGPHAGFYVSGLASDAQLELVHRLASGKTIPVHLMHRHRSGNYEVSSLRWSESGLVMVFRDGEVPA